LSGHNDAQGSEVLRVSIRLERLHGPFKKPNVLLIEARHCCSFTNSIARKAAAASGPPFFPVREFAKLSGVGRLGFPVGWSTDRLFPVKRPLVRSGFALGSLLQLPP